jgi:predicted RNA-binding Zn ribbon-like protein
MRYTPRMIVHPQSMPVPAVIGLVNGWGTQPRLQAQEQDHPFPPSATVQELLDLPGLPEFATSERQLRRLADALYPVFAADSAAARASLVNDLLERCRVRPAVAAAGGRVEEVWVVTHDRDALLAAASVCLRGLLAGHGPDRLGTCAGVRCADAYVDASPGGHRRYCSITCQNRNRVAAFRRRRAAAKSVDPQSRQA